MSSCEYCDDIAKIHINNSHYCKECYWSRESNKDRDNGRKVAIIMGIPTIALAAVIALPVIVWIL